MNGYVRSWVNSIESSAAQADGLYSSRPAFLEVLSPDSSTRRSANRSDFSARRQLFGNTATGDGARCGKHVAVLMLTGNCRGSLASRGLPVRRTKGGRLVARIFRWLINPNQANPPYPATLPLAESAIPVAGGFRFVIP